MIDQAAVEEVEILLRHHRDNPGDPGRPRVPTSVLDFLSAGIAQCEVTLRCDSFRGSGGFRKLRVRNGKGDEMALLLFAGPGRWGIIEAR